MAQIWNSRLLDGTTPAARYVPLDSIDFERRYWVPNSGWPLTLGELRPYYERAGRLCGLRFEPVACEAFTEDRPPLSTDRGDLITHFDQLGEAAVFTHGIVQELAGSRNVSILSEATTIDVRTGEGSHDGMAKTSVRTLDGCEFTVSSRVVLLAGGAIENARVLLSSTSECSAGLGNETDNVGRFFMDHPRVTLGYGRLREGKPTEATRIYEPHVVHGQLVLGKLKLSANALRRERLLNGNAQVLPYHLTPEEVVAARAARAAAHHVRRPGDLRRVPRELSAVGRQAVPLLRHVVHSRIARRDNVSSDASERWTGARTSSFKVIFQPEQAPNRANRVTLGTGRDHFGCRTARLEWRWSELDVQSIRRSSEIFAAELRASGFGVFTTVNSTLLPEGEEGWLPHSAHHHLGTTRMHDDPREGVVDRNCRLHGSTTVYVAGGSVFTTSGFANPTLTTIALALRLADELKRILAPRAIAALAR
jgi:choline dehydrogenase-like flavoprotein